MWELLQSTYKGKKIFLTGHTGFKGSWLLKILSLLGAEVKGYALAPITDNDLYHIIKGDEICKSVIDDIRNREKLVEEITLFKPDFVFHLAAQPLVRLSYEIPSDTFAINAVGTANVLDGVRALTGPCTVICITTDKVYHNNEWVYPYRENDRLGGYDPYSASKACTELVIDSYRNSFFSPAKFDQHLKAIAVGRAGNVIGGGDWSKDRLVPDIVRALSKNEKIEIRNPNSVRPWQHVLEPLLGYLILGGKLHQNAADYSTAYNFGPHVADTLPVIEMVNLAINKWGKGDFYLNQQTNQPHEAGLLKLDISKAIAELKWMPQNNAEKAVETTIGWYKTFFDDNKNIVAFTEQQIMDFVSSTPQ